MTDQHEVPARILAAARNHHQRPLAVNRQALQALDVYPLPGGMNNSVYMCRATERPYCIKIYKVDDRRRAEREWLSLRVLAERGLAVAPEPLWFDPDPNAPAIGMEYLPGVPLSQQELRRPILIQLADMLSQIYALTPACVDYPYLAIGRAPERIRRIEDWVDRMRGDTEAVAADLLLVAEQWLQGVARNILSQPAPAVFSSGDPNLANCLWDGAAVRCIDFEYGGWSDLAFDLADVREGLYAQQVPDKDWDAFLSCFELSDLAVHDRFHAARQLCSIFWGFLLWQRYRRQDLPEAQLKAHLHRIYCLLDQQLI